MGEITDFVNLYIEDSDILEDTAKDVTFNLLKNMRSNLWKGHGYDKGELHDDLSTDYSLHKQFALVTGWYTVEHGKYVISGVRGKGKAKSGPIDFLTKGLEKTLEMYK